jgi:hypothetical protein
MFLLVTLCVAAAFAASAPQPPHVKRTLIRVFLWFSLILSCSGLVISLPLSCCTMEVRLIFGRGFLVYWLCFCLVTWFFPPSDRPRPEFARWFYDSDENVDKVNQCKNVKEVVLG